MGWTLDRNQAPEEKEQHTYPLDTLHLQLSLPSFALVQFWFARFWFFFFLIALKLLLFLTS